MITNSVRRTFAIACAIGLSLAGCSSAPQGAGDRSARYDSNASVVTRVSAEAPQAKAPTPPPLPVIATAAPAQHPGIKLAINSLHRDSAGVVVLTWTLTNNSSDTFSVYAGKFDSISKYSGVSVSDVTLLDADHKIRYHTLRDAKTNYCVCTTVDPTGPHANIEPGHSATYFDAYTLASNASKATVEVPNFVGTKNVPIS